MPENQADEPTARLALEDGTIFEGRSFGARSTTTGEVVFNTAMCGYQEALTDPSYRGQILVMTASQMGNYGISEEDVESSQIAVRGFVIRELSRIHSNYRSISHLDQWLADAGIPGITDIDTRALVRRLREQGAMRGVISNDPACSDRDLVERARASEPMAGRNLAAEVTPANPGTFTEGLGEWGMPWRPPVAGSYRVAAIDCGAKRNIYRHLVDRGCEVRFLPLTISPEEVLESGVDGLFVSNGPGDPAAIEGTIETLRGIAGAVPTFGICLGHQLLALALGATTWKLKFGHRGANQPVRNLLTDRVEITSQNHGFCVDEDSLLEAGAEVTHRHLNDGTVAGFRHLEKAIFSVQYHPEASPGPHDSSYLFDLFIRTMAERRSPNSSDFAMAQSGRAGGARTI